MPEEDESMAEQSNNGLGFDYIMSLENVLSKLKPLLQIFKTRVLCNNDAPVHVGPVTLYMLHFFLSFFILFFNAQFHKVSKFSIGVLELLTVQYSGAYALLGVDNSVWFDSFCENFKVEVNQLTDTVQAALNADEIMREMTGMKKAPFSLGYIHGHREVTQPRIADTRLELNPIN
ncbi:hypothetical protein ACSQ67_011779 [Phaseolus vulgaris]